MVAFEALTDEQKALKEQQLKLQAVTDKILAEYTGKLEELERYRVPPKADAMDVLKAALFILKYDQKQLGGDKADWNVMRRLFKIDFIKRMEACDPTDGSSKGVAPYHRIASIKQLLEGKSKDELNQKSVVFGYLYEWCAGYTATKELADEQAAAAAEAS